MGNVLHDRAIPLNFPTSQPFLFSTSITGKLTSITGTLAIYSNDWTISDWVNSVNAVVLEMHGKLPESEQYFLN